MQGLDGAGRELGAVNRGFEMGDEVGIGGGHVTTITTEAQRCRFMR